MQTKEFPAICVAVKRGKESINLTVAEHEVEVLRAIYPAEGHVSVVAKPEGLTVDLDESAASEYARLVSLYNRTGQPDYVRAAFPMGVERLAKYGFSMGIARTKASTASAEPKVRKAEKPAKAEAKK